MRILLIFFIAVNINFLAGNEKLIFVELQSRHGARSPLNYYDNNKDFMGQNWTNSGELTGVGQRMEYILGLRNRKRYITELQFLSEKFDPHEILIFSTSLNRTLLSLTSQLQGFYPITKTSGEELSPEQLDISSPPMNISDVDNEEIISLGNWSMPNNITLIPIHMISPLEKRIVVYDAIDCKEKVTEITLKNKNENEDVVKLGKNFNDIYSKNLSKFLPFPENHEYDFDDIGKICDALIADSTEGRDLSNFFNKTNFDKDTLIEDCKEILAVSFSKKLYGDINNEVLLLEESPVLREMIHYMKQRVDADIKGEKIEENAIDYSRPKMVIISGHDTTVAAQLLFILKFFNLDLELYKLPTFSAQVAFEVSRNENKTQNLSYSDYHVCFYYNDDLILNTTMDEFIKTVEKNIWSTSKINKFCGILTHKGKEDDKNSLNMKMKIILGLGILIFCLIIIIIILVVKIFKTDKEDLDSIDSDKILAED